MLWTDALAFAASDAIGRFTVLLGIDLLIIIVCIPVMIHTLRVHAGEQIGNGDLPRAAFCAITAGSAGNEMHGMKDLSHLRHCFLLYLA